MSTTQSQQQELVKIIYIKMIPIVKRTKVLNPLLMLVIGKFGTSSHGNFNSKVEFVFWLNRKR